MLYIALTVLIVLSPVLYVLVQTYRFDRDLRRVEPMPLEANWEVE